MESDQPLTSVNTGVAPDERGTVTVSVNTKPVVLTTRRLTGIEIKGAAIGQGVAIELDFLLTLEAGEGRTAKTIADDETINVSKNSVFTANDGDDDS
jgi:hypothetical protein